MKKFVSFILFTVLILSLSMFSAAETKTTTVSYEVKESYTVTIPPSVTLSTAGETKAVSITDVLLAKGREIVMTVASTNSYKVKNGDAAIPYTVTAGSTTLPATPCELLRTAKDDKSAELSFAVAEEDVRKAAVVGAYTDTLTFTVEVLGTPPQPQEEKQTIKFTVNGTEYTAEEGMTWEAFIASEYNKGVFTSVEDYPYLGEKYIYCQEIQVCLVDTIESGAAYTAE